VACDRTTAHETPGPCQLEATVTEGAQPVPLPSTKGERLASDRHWSQSDSVPEWQPEILSQNQPVASDPQHITGRQGRGASITSFNPCIGWTESSRPEPQREKISPCGYQGGGGAMRPAQRQQARGGASLPRRTRILLEEGSQSYGEGKRTGHCVGTWLLSDWNGCCQLDRRVSMWWRQDNAVV